MTREDIMDLVRKGAEEAYDTGMIEGINFALKIIHEEIIHQLNPVDAIEAIRQALIAKFKERYPGVDAPKLEKRT